MLSDAIMYVAVPQKCSKPLEIGLLRGGYESKATRRCPIAIEQTGQIPPSPQGSADHGEDSGKDVMPAMSEGQKPQQHIDQ